MSAPLFRSRWLWLPLGLGAAWGVACGGGVERSGGGLDFGLTLSRAVADQAEGFQVALLANGSADDDCGKLQNTCLSTSGIPDSSFVRLTDASGAQKNVLFFANSLADGGTVATQQVTLQGIPPGKDFAVVVEAIGQGQLLGSSCNYLPEIRSGSNSPVLAVVQPPNPTPSCDPKIP